MNTFKTTVITAMLFCGILNQAEGKTYSDKEFTAVYCESLAIRIKRDLFILKTLEGNPDEGVQKVVRNVKQWDDLPVLKVMMQKNGCGSPFVLEVIEQAELYFKEGGNKNDFDIQK